MRRRGIACFIGLALFASDVAARCSEAAACVVTVTRSHISARFVADPAAAGWPTRWHWNRSSTNDNHLEYRWSLAFGECSSTGGSIQKHPHSLEVTLFKFPGAAERSGSFAELMDAAQGDLWRCDGIGCKVEQRVQFTGSLRPAYIEIAFRRDPGIDRLISGKPSMAVLDALGSDCHARVNYR